MRVTRENERFNMEWASENHGRLFFGCRFREADRDEMTPVSRCSDLPFHRRCWGSICCAGPHSTELRRQYKERAYSA